MMGVGYSLVCERCRMASGIVIGNPDQCSCGGRLVPFDGPPILQGFRCGSCGYSAGVVFGDICPGCSRAAA